jgi:folylpolyglutamate synthase/dihydropteroate synthase
LGTVIEVASPLHGAHQQRNIALAIAAAVELAFHHGVPITPASITAGIRNTRWPARLERIVTYADEEPAATQLPTQWILDVAHNPAGAWALRAALRSLLDLDGPDAQPPTLIFSCLRDKPIAEMAQILFPTFDRVIFAPIRSPRATPVADMLEAAASTGTPATAASSVAEAIELAEIPAPAPPAANSAKNIAHAPSTDASTTASASFGTGHDRGTHPVGGSRAESASKEDGTLAPEESSATNSARMASTPPNLPDTSNWREARSAPRAVAPRVVVAGSVYLVGEARALLLARAGVPA